MIYLHKILQFLQGSMGIVCLCAMQCWLGQLNWGRRIQDDITDMSSTSFWGIRRVGDWLDLSLSLSVCLPLCLSLTSFILQGLSLSMCPFPLCTSRVFKIIYMVGQGSKRVKTEAAIPLAASAWNQRSIISATSFTPHSDNFLHLLDKVKQPSLQGLLQHYFIWHGFDPLTILLVLRGSQTQNNDRCIAVLHMFVQ